MRNGKRKSNGTATVIISEVGKDRQTVTKRLNGVRVLCAGLLATVGCAWGIGLINLGNDVLAGVVTAHAVTNRCANSYPVPPPMPPSTGFETPAGFTTQMAVDMPGTTIAPASDANTLAEGYYMFNDMQCSFYTHTYTYDPPGYYYTDCVGFTGYATRTADPGAWQSMINVTHIGYYNVPTPYLFERFMNGLISSPQPYWQAVPDVQSIQPGDILAWQPALSNGQPNTAGVGHSVMVLATPKPIPGSNDQRWEFIEEDSTGGGHGPYDTRRNDANNPDKLYERNAPLNTTRQGTVPSGIGIGTMALDTTANGHVTGVEWDVGDRAENVVFGAARPLSTQNPTPGPLPPPPVPRPVPAPQGYDMATADGQIYLFGDAYNYGPNTPLILNKPMVGMSVTTDGNGYWEAAGDGGVFAYGTAPFQGSMAGRPLNAPIVGITSTDDQNGYWLVGSDGGVFAFGSANFYGSMGGRPLNRPIVGIAEAPGSTGYWEVGADGGVFTFGSANFYGSMGGHPLNQPIVGMAATPDGKGYWLVSADGGVFAFGDAAFVGSMAEDRINAPIISIVSSPDGQGYWLIGSDGGVYAFGDGTFQGGMGGQSLPSSVVAAASA